MTAINGVKRILIVDDHPLMRKGLALTLEAEPDLVVCAQAESAEDALGTFEEVDPDMAIVDISLPGMSGLELIKHLHMLKPELGILVVSRHEETLYAERAIRAGARGYVMKLEAGKVIVKAVRRVLDGGIYVSDEINERLLMGIASRQGQMAQSPLEVLSDRELEVFELTGRGLGTREIAERLHLSIKTVESYRARIKNKLNLSNAAELMQHAVQWVESEDSGRLTKMSAS
ncbi:response regulator [Rhodocaloribacter sp.]